MQENHLTRNETASAQTEQLPSKLGKALPTGAEACEATTPKPAPVDKGYPADPDFQLRGGYDNLMLDAATPLLGLVMRLRTLDALPNIEEVHHQRAFTLLAAQNVEIELVLQTRGKPHVEDVLRHLRAAGMEAALI